MGEKDAWQMDMFIMVLLCVPHVDIHRETCLFIGNDVANMVNLLYSCLKTVKDRMFSWLGRNSPWIAKD